MTMAASHTISYLLVPLALIILLCAATGCTGVDGENIELSLGIEDQSLERSFENLLASELSTALENMEFTCGPRQAYSSEDIILFCYSPERYSFGYESQSNRIELYKRSAFTPKTTLMVRTWYGGLLPWYPSADEFRKLSKKVHAVIDRIRENRTVTSRYTGSRYGDKPGKSPLS